MWHRITAAVVVVALLTLLSGCGGSTGKRRPPAATKRPAPGKVDGAGLQPGAMAPAADTPPAEGSSDT